MFRFIQSGYVNKHPRSFVMEEIFSFKSEKFFPPKNEDETIVYLGSLSKQCETEEGCIKLDHAKDVLKFILSLIVIDKTTSEKMKVSNLALDIIIKFQCIFLSEHPCKDYGKVGGTFVQAEVRHKLYELSKKCLAHELNEKLVVALGVASFCYKIKQNCDCSVFLPILKEILLLAQTTEHIRIFNSLTTLYGFSISFENKEIIYKGGVLTSVYTFLTHPVSAIVWSASMLIKSLVFTDPAAGFQGSPRVRAAIMHDGFFTSVLPALISFAAAGASAYTRHYTPLTILCKAHSLCESLHPLLSVVANMLWWQAHTSATATTTPTSLLCAYAAFAQTGLAAAVCGVLESCAQLPYHFNGTGWPALPPLYAAPHPTLDGERQTCIVLNVQVMNMVHTSLAAFLNAERFVRSGLMFPDARRGIGTEADRGADGEAHTDLSTGSSAGGKIAEGTGRTKALSYTEGLASVGVGKAGSGGEMGVEVQNDRLGEEKREENDDGNNNNNNDPAVSVWDVFAREGLGPTICLLSMCGRALCTHQGIEMVAKMTLTVSCVLHLCFVCGATRRKTRDAPNRYLQAAIACRAEGALLATLMVVQLVLDAAVYPRTGTQTWSHLMDARGMLCVGIIALHVGAVEFARPLDRYALVLLGVRDMRTQEEGAEEAQELMQAALGLPRALREEEEERRGA